MKAFSIFDDYPQEAIDTLTQRGFEVTLLEKGKERPSGDELKQLLEDYDVLIIGTAQKMPFDFFEGITSSKIIATASSGVDHIKVPEDKKELIKVINAPVANRVSVAEHTFALILALRKQILEGRDIAAAGLTKKAMNGKPRDLFGSTIGLVGAGGMATAVIKLAQAFGMKCIAWTPNPEKHKDLSAQGVDFVALDEVLRKGDIISVNIPLTEETKGLISAEKVRLLKESVIFISTSRAEITDNVALMRRAKETSTFCVGMDVDADRVSEYWIKDMHNVIVTPHIAGGTVESRQRLFCEVSENIICSGD